MRRIAIALTILALAAPQTACKRGAAAASADEAGLAAPFVVKDDTEGLLLTWIDEKGDFHVEQKVTDVPLVGRDAVRAVDPNREDGTHGDRVYVADLRVANPDGTYPVHTMTRDDFEQLAVTRRGKSGPTLAAAAPDADAGAGAAPAGNGDPALAAGRPTVIIYGASWCGACHQAQAYLKKKGVAFIEKDIEQDSGAAAEMRGKLRRAGIRNSGSIPVLDVRGRILVGFDPRSVDEALGAPI